MHSIQKLPTAGATQITVTNTSQTIEELIKAAGGSGFKMEANNALDLQVEKESVRYLIDGNVPVKGGAGTGLGFVLPVGSFKLFRGEGLSKLRLVSYGDVNALVNIQIGKINK